MLMLRSTVFSLALSALLLCLNACTPPYPKCDSDDHCAEKGEVCVANFCKQCRDDNQCTVAGQYCSSNQCTYKLGYCDDSRPCSGNQKCRENMCGTECLDNNECGSDQYCDEGSCTAKPECGPNADKTECSSGYECESGKCVERFTECRPSEPVYFDFDRSNVKRSERSKLDGVAECFKGDHVANMTLGGHTDEEGDVSYNLALGEERANSVRKYLERVGVSSSLLNPVSYGEDRPAVNGAGRQPKNRRVEFEAR